MKCRSVAICLVFSLLAASIAGAQAIKGLDSIYRLSTSRFEIYYPRSLANEAERIAGFADSTLTELESLFGEIADTRKIPMLLSDASMDLNGYSTTFPSNRIVIFCAEPDIESGLASLDDPLYLVFLHELTHEVTLNIRSPFWKFLKAVLGDFITPAAWIMPSSFVEGQAVSIESGYAHIVNTPEPQQTGRLNDPAALEPVFDEKRSNLMRSLWDVSGALDFPGAGNLPYLYGALFVHYLSERFGQQALVALWHEAGKGNFLNGFEGSVLAEGIVKKVTGFSGEQLWGDFQHWMEERASGASSNGGMLSENNVREQGSIPAFHSEAVPIPGRRVGSFTASKNTIFYFDRERQAVFQQIFDGRSFTQPRKLFDADGYVRRLTVSDDGKTLMVEWRAYDSNQILVPMQYHYDLENGRLIRDRPTHDVPAGVEGATHPQLQFASLMKEDNQTITYGLVREGASVFPARIFPDGRLELWKGIPGAVRSISIWKEFQTNSRDAENFNLILGLVGDDMISRPMLLEKRDGIWKAWKVECALPPGGAHAPGLLTDDRMVFASPGRNGINTLYWSEFSRTRLVPGGWEPYLNNDAVKEKESRTPVPTQAKSQRFPEAFRTSRLPWLNNESVGISLQAMDLTERLSWSANLGYTISTATPEASLAVALSTLKSRTVLLLQDGAAENQGSTAIRISSLFFGYDRYWNFIPIWKNFSIGLDARYAGLHNNYSADAFFDLNPDYLAMSYGIKTQYSTIRAASFPPFETNGFLVAAALSLEHTSLTRSSLAFSLRSITALASMGIQADFFLSGSIDSDELLFAPSGRYYNVSGSSSLSGRPADYPEYREYAAAAGKRFYAFSELSARLFNYEFTNSRGQSMVIKMPLLPSLLIRRGSLVPGSRIAWLFDSATSLMLSSLFIRAELDFSVLAGLIAQNHMIARCEFAFPLSPEQAGKSFLVSFSLKNGW